jgi:YVTN family beta-propeller protein
MGDNTVTVIDVFWSNTVIATIRVGSEPCALVYNSTNNKIYCANQKSNDVSIIDGTTSNVINTIAVGAGPSALVYNSVNNKAYCANANSNNVSVIDGASNNVIATINVGLYPKTLLYNPTNNKIYCANMDGENVTVIDGLTNSEIATIPVGRTPVSMCYNSTNNKIYCASWSNGRIHIINGETDQLIDSIIYGNSGPQSLIYDNNYNRIYYTNFTGDNIKVIDGISDTIIATIQLPSGTRPFTLISPYVFIYCANIGNNTVSVINPYYFGIVATINTTYPVAFINGHGPAAIRIYVANLQSSTLSVIRQNLPDIEEVKNSKQYENAFKVYPNPAKEYFTVRLPQTANSAILRMYDVSGKVVKEEKLKAQRTRAELGAGQSSKVKEQKIILDGISPGVYFISCGSAYKKIIIVDK